MHLSKTTHNAIRILVDCAATARSEPLTKASDISERLDITPQNTVKIVHLLTRAGFLEAQRGRHGGVKLARPAAEIQVGQVVRAIEEAISTRSDGSTVSPAEPLVQLVDDALDAFTTVLDKYTIAEMEAQKSKTKKRKTKTRAKKTKAKKLAKSSKSSKKSAIRTIAKPAGKRRHAEL